MMNLKTRFNLWKLKIRMGPSRAFKASLRKDLVVSWDAKYGTKAPWYQLGMRRVAAGFAVVTLVLTGAGGVYAYNSPKVTEGTALYPIKQVIEIVEEVAKITPEAKAKFYIKKIERREAEREILKKKIKIEVAERKIQRTEKSIDRVEEQLEQTDKIIEKIEFKDIKLREKVKERLKARLEKKEERLEIKSEQQKERRENLKEVRQNKNNKIEKGREKKRGF